jgi:hypothetical protein
MVLDSLIYPFLSKNTQIPKNKNPATNPIIIRPTGPNAAKIILRKNNTPKNSSMPQIFASAFSAKNFSRKFGS